MKKQIVVLLMMGTILSMNVAMKAMEESRAVIQALQSQEDTRSELQALNNRLTTLQHKVRRFYELPLSSFDKTLDEAAQLHSDALKAGASDIAHITSTEIGILKFRLTREIDKECYEEKDALTSYDRNNAIN